MFRAQLEAYRESKETIPNNIFLIWIGNDIPNTKEQPYIENAIKHKKLYPQAKVEILVNQNMLEVSGKWQDLKKYAEKNKIILRDILSTCQHYLNYDVILKLMKNKKDYVWASDILRLSLMYHEGGRYFDTDLTPSDQKPVFNDRPPLGFYQFFSEAQQDKKSSPEPLFQASTKGHFIYFLALVFTRYFYEAAIQNFDEAVILDKQAEQTHWLHTLFASIRQDVICQLSGNAISYILVLFDINFIKDISYQLKQYYEVDYHGTWLKEGFIDFSGEIGKQLLKEPGQRKINILMRIVSTQSEAFKRFMASHISKFTEKFIIEKGKEYFHIDLFLQQKPLDSELNVPSIIKSSILEENISSTIKEVDEKALPQSENSSIINDNNDLQPSDIATQNSFITQFDATIPDNKAFDEKKSIDRASESNALQTLLNAVEEQVGNFNDKYIYQISNDLVVQGCDTKREEMPAALLLTSLGLGIQGTSNQKQFILPKAIKSLQDIKPPSDYFCTIHNDDEENDLKIPYERIKHTIDSVQVFANETKALENVSQFLKLGDEIAQGQQATSLCVAVYVDFFIETSIADTNKEYKYNINQSLCSVSEGDAVPKLRSGTIDRNDPYVTMLSTPGLNFSYGHMSSQDPTGDMAIQYIKEMYTTIFRTAIVKDCKYIIMPAAGLAGFHGDPETYFTCLNEVAANFPNLNIIYHPGGEHNKGIFKKIFDKSPRANVFTAKKDLLSITQEMIKQGHHVAYHNPSDPKAVFGERPLGEYFLSGNFLGEEQLALITGLTLGSRKLNPKPYAHPTDLRLAYYCKQHERYDEKIGHEILKILGCVENKEGNAELNTIDKNALAEMIFALHQNYNPMLLNICVHLFKQKQYPKLLEFYKLFPTLDEHKDKRTKDSNILRQAHNFLYDQATEEAIELLNNRRSTAKDFTLLINTLKNADEFIENPQSKRCREALCSSADTLIGRPNLRKFIGGLAIFLGIALFVTSILLTVHTGGLSIALIAPAAKTLMSIGTACTGVTIAVGGLVGILSAYGGYKLFQSSRPKGTSAAAYELTKTDLNKTNKSH